MKPPYTKWINDIKTKLGFNRTMTASGEDVVDAVNKQADAIGDLTDLETTAKTDLVSAVNENKTLIDSVADLKAVNLESCSSLADIFTALKNSKNRIGYGRVGSSQTTNLKTLLGATPTTYYYGTAAIILFAETADTAVAMVIAGHALNANQPIAIKYLMRNNNNYTQTVWTNYNAQS